ncbi:hypothetical protein N7522_000237 [Penicillium canescens]|uniref:Peptidase S33 tripeptidyl aminopeptidase-like C-terminal domain-containing protein n=1 Tax=Penicillium canescens TaxID=5083 RepID=A0AAD6I9W4_PENCN|nr:hypothetical protein N7522_000237 [Penicillium canescens]KAJ6038110.1 hypothetical protein N7460_007881 [Penicillium canescens]KAJ6061200.1 hypothetical protein N7444_001896 [Penicillium canescens]
MLHNLARTGVDNTIIDKSPNTVLVITCEGISLARRTSTSDIFTEQNTLVLIVNGEDDPVTPLAPAERLRSQLPTSSRLVTRRGPGHTTVSVVSLGLVEAIRAYFIDNTLPTSAVHDLSQLVFSSAINAGTLTTPSGVQWHIH